MDEKDVSASEPKRIPSINFFRPLPGYMRRRAVLTWILLAAWALLTFGFQWLLYLTQNDPMGNGPLTRTSLFKFPFHILFTGQILILCYIALCYVFNSFMDWITRKDTKRHN